MMDSSGSGKDPEKKLTGENIVSIMAIVGMTIVLTVFFSKLPFMIANKYQNTISCGKEDSFQGPPVMKQKSIDTIQPAK